MMQAKWGLRALSRLWFPLLYLAFAIPPPSFVLDALTAPLKAFVSMAATKSLALFGLPIARIGRGDLHLPLRAARRRRLLGA